MFGTPVCTCAKKTGMVVATGCIVNFRPTISFGCGNQICGRVAYRYCCLKSEFSLRQRRRWITRSKIRLLVIRLHPAQSNETVGRKLTMTTGVATVTVSSVFALSLSLLVGGIFIVFGDFEAIRSKDSDFSVKENPEIRVSGRAKNT